MYGVPPRGHLQGQTHDYSNMRFFHTKKEYIYTCSNIISVVYMRRIISCLKGITLFNHIPHKEGRHLLKIKKRKKRRMPITKTKHV